MRLLSAMAMAVLLLAGGLTPASAQVKGAKQAQKAKAKQLKQAKQAAVLERFLQMSPKERDQALRQLPPVQRQRILRRLSAVESLSAQERRSLRGRFDTFLDMPPERQVPVRRELQQLRQLTPEQRRARLASPELRDHFSEDEIRFLSEVDGQQQ